MTPEETPDLIPELHEFVRVREARKLPPLTMAELAEIDRQIAVVEKYRDLKRERRMRDEAVEVERRQGFDRRQLVDKAKG